MDLSNVDHLVYALDSKLVTNPTFIQDVYRACDGCISTSFHNWEKSAIYPSSWWKCGFDRIPVLKGVVAQATASKSRQT